MWYVIILIYLDLPDSDLWLVDGSSRSVMRACCDCNSSCHGRNAHKIGPFKAKRATKCGRLFPRSGAKIWSTEMTGIPMTAIHCYYPFASGGRTGTSVLPRRFPCHSSVTVFCWLSAFRSNRPRLQCLHSCLHRSHLRHIFPSCLGGRIWLCNS